MDTLELSIVRAGLRASRWLAAGLLCLGTGACAELEPRDEVAGDIDRLAERLVQTARERADLRQIRVWVAEIQQTRPQTTRATATPDDMIGLQLEHELVIALATRLNVVESEFVEPSLAPPARGALSEGATARGATHVLVGDYVRQRDVIQITLRLIDAESRLIVAAARGEVKLAEVGLMGFDRWARNGGEALAPPGVVQGTAVAQPSRIIEQKEVASAAPAAVSVSTPKSTLQPPTAKGTLQPTARATLQPPAAKATHQPPAPVAATAPPQPEVKPSSVPATAPEDFESWRQRRQAERESSASKTVAALDQAARASVDPAVRARRNELAIGPQENEEFPWRRNPWLARLLGIPETPRSGQH